MPPYISMHDTFFGHWSTVPAEYSVGSCDSAMNNPT